MAACLSRLAQNSTRQTQVASYLNCQRKLPTGIAGRFPIRWLRNTGADMKEIIPAIDQAWAVRCVINGRLRDINKGSYTGEGSMLFLRRLEAAYDTLMHIAN